MSKYHSTYFKSVFYQKLTDSVFASVANVSKKMIGGIPGFGEISQAVLKKEVDFGIFPLSQIPIERSSEIVITALTERKHPAECLLVKKEKTDPSKILKLPHGASVSVYTEMQGIQLLHFRPDIVLKKIDWSNLYNNTEFSFDTDGIILPDEFENLFAHDYFKLPLQPTEFIPTPGQGTLAFIVLKENLPVRRFLKSFHKKSVSRCTNVERMIQKSLNQPVAGVCLQNPDGYFHVHAASVRGEQLRHMNFASSTTLGLAKEITDELSQKES